MRLIRQLTDDIRSNIDEAERHINAAYALIETNRQAADWYRDMATAHLGFNAAGHAAARKLVDEQKANGSPLVPGMLAVYEAVHADLIKRTAQVRAMVDMYGK